MTSPEEDEAKVRPEPTDELMSSAGIAAPRAPRWTPLRLREQTAVALLLGTALIWMGTRWLASGGATGHLVDVEVEHAENSRRPAAPYLVDINSADVAELGELPQVGPNLARRMIEYREQNGPFRSADDLLRVKGIGPKTLAALRPHVRCE